MLVDVIKSIVYGIIEGITEWLPISSTGHLILAEEWIPFKNVSDNFFEMFQVVIQLGAIFAVILLFWNKLWPFQKSVKQSNSTRFKSDTFCPWIKPDTFFLWIKVMIATIPSIVIGLPLDDWMDAHLYNKVTVSITLILYGIMFILVERYNKHRKPTIANLNTLTYKTALIIGGFQILALIPGTSRSGATILGAILVGVSRPVAAEFSFFLAIPTMMGASLLKVVKFGLNFTGTELLVLITGMVVSFLVSVVAIRFLMNYVKKKDFSFFGYYRIVLGAIVLLYYLLNR